jgi:ribosomal protein S18 acetylase RimI-like enzyme
MNKLFEDKFVSHLIGYKCFFMSESFNLNLIQKLKKPFFITFKCKSKTKLSTKYKDLEVKLASKMVTYERKYLKDLVTYVGCREAQKKDIPQLKKICLEDTSNSRFFNDLKLPLKFRKNFRAAWLLNYFKKKRGDILIVALDKNKVLGFILMLKKCFGLQIDLIVSSKKHQNKKVGTTLINYVNNNYLKKNDIIRAGTQIDNIKANKIYAKIGFIKKKTSTFIYHVHSN